MDSFNLTSFTLLLLLSYIFALFLFHCLSRTDYAKQTGEHNRIVYLYYCGKLTVFTFAEYSPNICDVYFMQNYTKITRHCGKNSAYAIEHFLANWKELL